MPIRSREDAADVEERIAHVFGAPPDGRATALRGLFVEALDFDAVQRRVRLSGAPGAGLPATADYLAELDGVHVLYVALDAPATGRVRAAEAIAAARLIAGELGDDLLLVFSNAGADQLHFVRPDLAGPRPTLRRLVFEQGQHNRTAVQQISNIYWEYQDTGSIRDALDEAFDVEPVTKRFFAEYKRVFEGAEQGVSGFADGEEDERRLFVQTLFNRLMFVYFLQRKGWLDFHGDKDYLKALWNNYRRHRGETDNFHVNWLRSLFFAGLNNPDSRDVTAGTEPMLGKVPFLNGGLFEQGGLDTRDGVTVPDEAIEAVLTGLFDRFNFTVMESTPFDIEVAVDPEMLGKVFEELVTGRHESGSYYTPRTVVSFMCREALKGYLEARETGLPAGAIAAFVDERQTDEIDVAAARRVAGALSEVTVVDPACGSGAYLLGMMQELVDLQTTLFNAGADAKSLHQLKLEIIERNLYGVDIDEFAVNIAMLRMWLSLAIEYEGEKLEPLPNLDFKVVCGDSLLAPDPSQLNLERGLVEQSGLGTLKAGYLISSDGAEKDRLRGEIASAEEQIREALGDASDMPAGCADWRVEFAEVFVRGGFDVAVANPPYHQLQSDGGRLGDLYRGVGYRTFARTGDVYGLFYERGCELLKPRTGILAYITSNSWLRAEYGKRLRRHFAERHTPLRWLDLGKDVFTSAIVDSGVLLLRTGGSAAPFPAVDMDRLPGVSFPPAEEHWGRVRPDGEAPWSVLSLTEQSVMDKMRAVGTPLAEWDVRINFGIKTGYNAAFIIDDTTRDTLIAEDPSSKEIIKPILRGRDIQRWRADWDGKWLLNIPWHFPMHAESSISGASKTAEDSFKARYPGVYRYLLHHKPKLAARNQSEVGIRYEWYALQRWGANYYEEFTKPKIFWIELVGRGRFAYDESGFYPEATTFIMTGYALKFLCAVLNSALAHWFLGQAAPTSGMGTLRWKKVYVERIPIPQVSAAEQRPFVKLVDRIIRAKTADPDADTTEWEREIDRRVYDLYGLTGEEVDAVEGHV